MCVDTPARHQTAMSHSISPMFHGHAALRFTEEVSGTFLGSLCECGPILLLIIKTIRANHHFPSISFEITIDHTRLPHILVLP